MYTIATTLISAKQLIVNISPLEQLSAQDVDDIINKTMRLAMTMLETYAGSLSTTEFEDALLALEPDEILTVSVAHQAEGFPSVAYGKVHVMSPHHLEFVDQYQTSVRVELSA